MEMNPQPAEQHRWLQQLIGEWRFESEAQGMPGGEPERSSGTEVVRPLGDLWVICEGTGTMPGGGEARMVMTLGYDLQQSRFVGTWIGSMMTYLFIYRGELSEDSTRLSLFNEGPNFLKEGETTEYLDLIELRGENERLLISHARGEDGSWVPFMTARYTRTG